MFPTFGPRRSGSPSPAAPDWSETPAGPEEPRERKPYRRNTAGVVRDLRAALVEMPLLPGKRGMRDRILHPRPTEGPAAAPGPREPKGPTWLLGWRQQQEARLAARSQPSQDDWAMSPDAYAQPGPVAAPEPMYQDDWHTPSPQGGASWDLAPPGAAGPDPWQRPAAYGAPSANGAPGAYGQSSPFGAPLPFNGHEGTDLDSRYDTGSGWSIVTSGTQDDPSRSYIRLHAVQPRRGALMYRIIGDLTHLTFNMTLLAIILTILAIPTAIGISRVTGVHIPVPWQVAAPTPRPIPTPYPGYKTYSASGFNIAYPSGWKVSPYTTPLRLGEFYEDDFYEPSNLYFGVGYTTFPQDELILLLEAAPDVFSQGHYANFQVTLTPRAGPTVDGHQSLWETFTFDFTDGKHMTPMAGAGLAMSGGPYSYLIFYYAPADQFGAVQAQYFTPMLASFRFRT